MFIANESLRRRHSFRSAMFAVYIRSSRSEDNIELPTSINISLLRREDTSLPQKTSRCCCTRAESFAIRLGVPSL